MTAPSEIRQEALRFLYERRALPHQLSAISAGLRRAGCTVTPETTLEALDYLQSAKLVDKVPGPFGGGNNAATWKITHLGCNQHEEGY